jgi:hypothetical protein
MLAKSHLVREKLHTKFVDVRNMLWWEVFGLRSLILENGCSSSWYHACSSSRARTFRLSSARRNASLCPNLHLPCVLSSYLNMPTFCLGLRWVAQPSTTGLSMLGKSLKELEADHPIALCEKGLEEHVIRVEFLIATIDNFESGLLDEISCQGAVLCVIADTVGKPH